MNTWTFAQLCDTSPFSSLAVIHFHTVPLVLSSLFSAAFYVAGVLSTGYSCAAPGLDRLWRQRTLRCVKPAVARFTVPDRSRCFFLRKKRVLLSPRLPLCHAAFIISWLFHYLCFLYYFPFFFLFYKCSLHTVYPPGALRGLPPQGTRRWINLTHLLASFFGSAPTGLHSWSDGTMINRGGEGVEARVTVVRRTAR